MNIAFIIGNSNYENLTTLEACKNDMTTIEAVLKATGKYDNENIIVEKNKKSSEIKKNLTEIINKYKQEKSDIDELLFYYTGHGCFKDEQFYYLPTDYNSSKHNATSLSNEELDEMIKSLSPNLTVKIIDACESGQTYIKAGKSERENYFSKSQNKFAHCYFMYSSNKNQVSEASDKYSFFTLSFLRALKNCTENKIRYKDIMDFISDDFSDNDEQTPFFVTQADFTDYFCEDLTVVQGVLASYKLDIEDDVITLPENENTNLKSLVETISEKSKSYIAKDKALENINEIKLFTESIKLNEELKDIFDFSIKVLNEISSVVGIDSLFSEVEKYKDAMFLDIKTGHEEYETEVQVPKKMNPLFSGFYSPLFQEYEMQTVTRKRIKTVGFEHSLKTPASGFSLKLSPKFPNIKMYALNIIFIFNKHDFIIYANTVEYVESSWGQWKRHLINSWNKSITEFSDVEKIKQTIEKYIANFQKDVYDKLEAEFQKEIKEKLCYDKR